MGKSVWYFAATFGLMGLALLIVGGFALHLTLSFRKSAVSADGVVVDLIESRSVSDRNGVTYHYYPVVEYVDPSGKRHFFTGNGGSAPASYGRGEKVAVRFDPADPEKARIDSFMENWSATALFGGIGALVFSIGAGFGIAGLRRARDVKWLRAKGKRVQARYTGVIQDTSLTVNSRNPYRLTAQWQHPSTGVMHTFRSDVIWYEPSEFVQRTTLDVLLNVDKPKVYEVDIGFLPKSS